VRCCARLETEVRRRVGADAAVRENLLRRSQSGGPIASGSPLLMLKSKRQLGIAACIAVAATVIVVGLIGRANLLSSHRDRMDEFPGLILWAWERPEHLNFIDPREIGVAFLARTLRLRGDDVIVRTRHQPLDVPPNTQLMAVVRIEPDYDSHVSLSAGLRSQILASIVELARTTSISAIQIDFDARDSERQFYRETLTQLRLQLPPLVRLSITALASWCTYDTWIGDLPIDEAVPMLFRMGKDARMIENFLKSGNDFSVDVSRQSVGISTDEPIETLPKRRRIYVFSPKPWTEEAVKQVIQETQRWR
jgi:hypothetical protein